LAIEIGSTRGPETDEAMCGSQQEGKGWDGIYRYNRATFVCP